jgi:hypothetical protein
MKKNYFFAFALAITFIGFASSVVAQQVQWQRINTAFGLTDVNGSTTRLNAPINSMIITFQNGTPVLWVAGENGNFRTTSGGLTWDSTVSFNTSFQSVAQRGSNLFTLAKANGQTFVLGSTNGGDIWNPVQGAVTSELLTNLVSNGRVLVASGERRGLYISANDGVNWRLADVAQNCTMLQTIGQTIYAGTKEGFVFRSSDDGATWENLGCACSDVTCITTIGNTLVVGGTAGVCISTNLGETWVSKNNGLFAQHISALIVAGDWLYASSEGSGVYRVQAIGPSRFGLWTPVNSGLGNLLVSDMVITGNTLWAGTQNSIYSAVLGGSFTSVEEQDVFGAVLSPTPITNNAIFTYSSPVSGVLTITDINGDIVSTQEAIAGENTSLPLNISSLPSGRYTLRLVAGSSVSHYPMIIVR